MTPAVAARGVTRLRHDGDGASAPRVPGETMPASPATPRDPSAARSPRVPGYELPAPSEADVLLALTRQFGPERAAAVLEGALQAAGLRPEDAPFPPGALARVADVLAQQDGVTRVIGRSFAIRLATYLVLRRRTAPSVLP